MNNLARRSRNQKILTAKLLSPVGREAAKPKVPSGKEKDSSAIISRMKTNVPFTSRDRKGAGIKTLRAQMDTNHFLLLEH